MLAVPGQEVVDLMRGRDRNMKSVNRRLFRQCTSMNQFVRQCRCLVSERETWNPANGRQPAGPHNRIAKSGLVEHRLRDEQIVGTPAAPPAASDCLVAGDHDVAARPTSQVTDDACLVNRTGNLGGLFP